MQSPGAPPFWFIIANPVSGGGAMQRRWPAIEKALRETGLNYTLHFTTGPGHAARPAAHWQDVHGAGRQQLLVHQPQ